MKAGKFYRIGRTNKLDRRQYEVGVQLPEKYERCTPFAQTTRAASKLIGTIAFSEKRLNGDWFRLSAIDVRVFKRRKFM